MFMPEINNIYETRKNHEEKITDNVKERIESRRQKVYALYLKGHTNQEIAKEVGTSLSTIEKDIHEIKKEYKTWFHNLNETGIYQMFRDSCEQLVQIRNELWKQYEKETESKIKLKILDDLANLALKMDVLIRKKPYMPSDFQKTISNDLYQSQY